LPPSSSPPQSRGERVVDLLFLDQLGVVGG